MGSPFYDDLKNLKMNILLLSLTGTAHGNCGWSVPFGAKNVRLGRQFHRCTTDEDAFCGLLHCQFHEPASYGSWKMKVRALTDPHETILPGTNDSCKSMAFDAGKYKLMGKKLPRTFLSFKTLIEQVI